MYLGGCFLPPFSFWMLLSRLWTFGPLFVVPFSSQFVLFHFSNDWFLYRKGCEFPRKALNLKSIVALRSEGLNSSGHLQKQVPIKKFCTKNSETKNWHISLLIGCVNKPIHLSVYFKGQKKHLFQRKFLF